MAHCLMNYAMLLTCSRLVTKQGQFKVNLVYLGQLQAVPLVGNAPLHTTHMVVKDPLNFFFLTTSSRTLT